ncbi:MAG: hypothetical protein RBR87_09060 [Bacteroidales bacterium]|jgi:hypothetical protein|nr:hypothetical protein [Bacteroidales bacterium]
MITIGLKNLDYFCSMFKQKLIHTFSLMMATVFLISSVGLTINAHYCFSTNTLKKSIFTADIRCNHEGQTCNIEPKAEADSTQCCSEKEANTFKSECCTDFTKYVKLVTSFDLPSVKIVFNHFIGLVIRIVQFSEPTTEESPLKTYSENNQKNLPLLTGTTFLIACSQLKLDALQL